MGTTSVRRTVAVAVTLLAAQVLLGAVIGIVTFGGGDDAPTVTAQPPAVVVRTSAPGTPAPQPTTPGSVSRSRGSVALPPPVPPGPAPATRPGRRDAVPVTSRSAVPAATTPPATVPARTTAPSPTPTFSAPALLPPPGFGDDVDPVPVLRAHCDDEGALDHTATGQPVRCARSRDGHLRWHAVP
ncbi:hypothetical protein L083_7011 [Actinoplanes sp. N902-109]|nr:hypothetical protein L083_7011 [Actinoplanes sp. N902-109]